MEDLEEQDEAGEEEEDVENYKIQIEENREEEERRPYISNEEKGLNTEEDTIDDEKAN